MRQMLGGGRQHFRTQEATSGNIAVDIQQSRYLCSSSWSGCRARQVQRGLRVARACHQRTGFATSRLSNVSRFMVRHPNAVGPRRSGGTPAWSIGCVIQTVVYLASAVAPVIKPEGFSEYR